MGDGLGKLRLPEMCAFGQIRLKAEDDDVQSVSTTNSSKPFVKKARTEVPMKPRSLESLNPVATGGIDNCPMCMEQFGNTDNKTFKDVERKNLADFYKGLGKSVGLPQIAVQVCRFFNKRVRPIHMERKPDRPIPEWIPAQFMLHMDTHITCPLWTPRRRYEQFSGVFDVCKATVIKESPTGELKVDKDVAKVMMDVYATQRKIMKDLATAPQ